MPCQFDKNPPQPGGVFHALLEWGDGRQAAQCQAIYSEGKSWATTDQSTQPGMSWNASGAFTPKLRKASSIPSKSGRNSTLSTTEIYPESSRACSCLPRLTDMAWSESPKGSTSSKMGQKFMCPPTIRMRHR